MNRRMIGIYHINQYILSRTQSILIEFINNFIFYFHKLNIYSQNINYCSLGNSVFKLNG